MKTIINNDCEIGKRMQIELNAARSALEFLPPAVSIYGGSRVMRSDPYYQHTLDLAQAISGAGIPVISGGGPGIMEAANKGARTGEHGPSVGLTIMLPLEGPNEHLDISLMFTHFSARKITFCRHSRAFVCMPGGIGTLDELFEVLTLVQTAKMPETPVILFGSEFWGGLLTWLTSTVLARGLISEVDIEQRIQVVDTIEAAMEIILSTDADIMTEPELLSS